MLVNAGKAFFRSRIEANTTPFFPTITFYIACSPDTTTPALGDTTLTSELSGSGMGRAIATLTHTTGQNNWNYSLTFTYTGSTPQIVGSVAMFDAASGGNMITHDLLNAPLTVATNGDAIPVTLLFPIG